MNDLKPRVALFLPDLNGGGAERVMLDLSRGLSDRGHLVDLILVKRRGPYLVDVSPSVRLIDLGRARIITAMPSLVRYLRRERPYALIATRRHAIVTALWSKRISAVPLRLIIRESNVFSIDRASRTAKRRIRDYLASWSYAWADEIVANSHGLAADVADAVRLPLERIHVIHNPVVTPDLYSRAEEPVDHPWFEPGEPPVVLGVGRLNKQKDFSTLIRAFALVRQQRAARLLILGEGKERRNLENLVQALGLNGCVMLPGFVTNPFAYMARAAVFALSSAWEGSPNVLVQAMACGCPVVSTDCRSGPREILNHGEYGALVPVGDSEKLAAAIVRVLHSQPDGALLRARAREAFALDGIVDQYLTLLAGPSGNIRESLDQQAPLPASAAQARAR